MGEWRRRSTRRYAGHVGQAMRYTLVAIDAGLFAVLQPAGVDLCGARALPGEIHVGQVMAVAAFQRIIGLEPLPFVRGPFQAPTEQFFAGVDGARTRAWWGKSL